MRHHAICMLGQIWRLDANKDARDSQGDQDGVAKPYQVRYLFELFEAPDRYAFSPDLLPIQRERIDMVVVVVAGV